MRYRILLLAAVLASGLAGAETIAIDNGIAVKQSDVPTPTRGMTMDQVSGKFGAPATKVPAVGKPRGGDIGVSGKAIVRQGLQIGKHPDAQSRAGKESNLIAQGFRFAGILRDDDEGPRGPRRGLGDRQRGGSAIQFAPFDQALIARGKDWFE